MNSSFDIVNTKWGTTQADIKEDPNEIERSFEKLFTAQFRTR